MTHLALVGSFVAERIPASHSFVQGDTLPITAFNSFSDGIEPSRRSREHFIAQIDVEDDRLWVPYAEGVWFQPCCFNVTSGGFSVMTGINWIKESGFLEGPILLTGTHSVGTVRDAAIQWQLKNGRQFVFTYPVVAETFDFLNDANGEHVKPVHASQALDRAASGRVEEGAVGGGTGMGCNGFKGGVGTSSRVLSAEQGGYTLGVLVQCNYSGDLRILGVPIRAEITDLGACTVLPQPLSRPCRPSAVRPTSVRRFARYDEIFRPNRFCGVTTMSA